ncbi:MAG: hypothetical protein KIT25_09550 [Enhydrobacter sp.]|nr:MAG: hypothetical protein KIT25_09550 [Enhydrobacter sp.]
MKHAVIAALVIVGLASACAVRSERTVVEKPVPARTATVVTTDPPPPPGTTVVVPAR